MHANWTQHRPGLTLNLKMVNNHNTLAITQLYKVASYHSKTYEQVVTHDKQTGILFKAVEFPLDSLTSYRITETTLSYIYFFSFFCET